MDALILRKFIQKVYCQFDYDKLVQLYGYEPNDENYKNPYLQEKWTKFRKDWSNWYCSLDDAHSEKFIQLLEEM